MNPQAWTSEAVAAFHPSVDASPFGMAGPVDVLAGSFLYEFEDGPRRALVAARPMHYATGTRLDIVGMVSLGERLRVDALDAEFLEMARAHKAKAMTMCTRWPHLVRACARAGWVTTGTVMKKSVIYER